MIVVDPDVTRLKLDRELELWREHEETYRRRGWILLGQNELAVDIGFLGRLPIGHQSIPAMTACVQIDFTNYDLAPPSVEFIDPFSRSYASPPVQALVETDEGPRDLVVNSHPDTNRPFFCVPGIRQYHDHPQHSGDSWLLHRGAHEGSLATVCDRLWRAMVRNLLGIQVQIQTLPGQLQIQLRLATAPGEVAPALWEQVVKTENATREAQAALTGERTGDSQAPAAFGIAPAVAATPRDER